LAETASYDPSRVKIDSAVFAVGDDKYKKERKGKGRKKNLTKSLYFTYL